MTSLFHRPAADRPTGPAPSVTALLLAGAAFVVAVLVAGFAYLGFIEDSLWKSTVDDVLEITDQSAHAFEVYLEKDLKKLDILVSVLEPVASTDTAAIVEHCAYFNKAQNIYGVVNLDTGYLYTGTESEGLRLPDEVWEAYRDFPDRGVREPYVGDYTGLKMVGYFQRIDFADGVPALVYEGAPVSRISEEFTMSFFEDRGFSYIVNGRGDVLVRPVSRHSNDVQGNIVEAVGSGANGAESVSALTDSLAASRSGVVRVRLDDRDCVMAFVPIENTDGWSMVSVIPDDVIMEQGNAIIGTSTVVLFLVILVVGAAAFFGLAASRFTRSMRAQGAETRAREELFSVLASATDEVFLMLSRDPVRVDYVSPNVDRILGVGPDEVRADCAVLELEDAEGPVDTASLDDGRTVVREGLRHNRATGEPLWFTDSLYDVEVDGGRRCMAVLSDRTRERRNEEVLREALSVAEVANESKSTFLSNVSHDIRTPMNAIVGLATLLLRDAGDPDLVRDHTRKIQASSQHMLGLLNDVLDMSKIESGKTTLNLSEFELSELAEDVVTIARPQALAKGQDFRVNVSGVRDGLVVGDKLRINQVLINIITNAVKYTPEGGTVEFDLVQMPSPRANFVTLRFTVRDDGMGMAPEFMETLFDPFTREENSVTNRVQGTGLGLAITKSLVELMGGAISVESEVGRGSTFVVDLELRVARHRDSREFFERMGIGRVLVVDDERAVCDEVVAVMGDAGVGAEFALTGADAVSMAAEAEAEGRGFGLVIVDWRMPGMDGAQTARAIREVVPHNVPVMVLTAFDRADAESACDGAGVDGFLQKPFFLSSLTLLLEELSGCGGEAAPAPGDASIEGLHFLAAEDNALSASILEELLAMEGATVELVSNGQEALERFEGARPGTFDAVLMDVQMPVLDGYGATRAIRSCGHPDAATTPIVAMTANAFVDDVARALAAGMDMHMAKPVDIASLGAVLGEARAKRAAANGKGRP
ncbi:response regulator [Caniella muris]|uniref:response regulator n=1 Tax=Caniella muris TaxID=2941502 RepID=UPI00203B1B50|nr:response regulator [Caniella muris]